MRHTPKSDPAAIDALLPLTTIIARTSNEIRQLGAIATALDEFLGQVDLVALGRSSVGLDVLQKVDLMAQSLAGLADFTAELAQLTPPEVEVEVANAIRVLTMESLVRALGGPAQWTDLAPLRPLDQPILF